ncbi:MAG: nicotinate (nicotinamide) nucleotide adenylyltransferase [Nitrospirota bacterium]|nr:MAG: nicotinate (nicotinamide) nucleotide adenylyltransferase [Nitrospirota bacterium]
MHIGIFGGTFNPIHSCHLLIAEQVQAELKLDQVLFIPTGDPPHKASTSLAPASHRLAMVQIALEGYPTFTTSDVEVRSSRISYSFDTITILKQQYSADTEWSFIVGLDAFLDFPSWKEASRLLALCHFIVCSRPGTHFRSLALTTGLPTISHAKLEGLDTGQSHRLDVELPTGKHLTLLSLPPCEASASTIRNEISAGHSVSRWLPAPVESYIMKHRLYQCPLQ